MTFFIDVSRDMQINKETGRIAAIPVIVKTDVDEYVETAFHEETRLELYLNDVEDPMQYVEENTDKIYDAVIVANPVKQEQVVVKAADVGLEELVWWTEPITVIKPDEALVSEEESASDREEPVESDSLDSEGSLSTENQ